VYFEQTVKLCDVLELPTLALSENLVYHFKYFDMLNGKAKAELEDFNGLISKDKFLEWWLRPISEYEIN
jgi:hypothetical protein